MLSLSLRLFGAIQIKLDGELLDVHGPNQEALLIYLMLERERPHSRAHLANFLWDEGKVEQSLRTALSKLRTALTGKPASGEVLRAQDDPVELAPGVECDIDVEVFEDLLDSCKNHPHWRIDRCARCISRMEQAISMYRGGFLDMLKCRAEGFEEWRRTGKGGCRTGLLAHAAPWFTATHGDPRRDLAED